MSLMSLRSARILALLAAFPVSLSLWGCGGEEVKYEARPAVAGAKAQLPPVPNVAKKPIKAGDAYTVYGASYYLRSRVHRKEVAGKKINLTGYITKTNLAEAPECAVHKGGKADPEALKLTAADLLNDRVVPFFDAHEVKLSRVLTDRGTEYCGNPEHHEYELYLAVEDVDHSRTKTKNPQTNGIVERFHKTVLNEFYRVVFRKKIYGSIAELQADLDAWIRSSNEDRPHQGRWCFGKTPRQTFLDAIPLAREKVIAA